MLSEIKEEKRQNPLSDPTPYQDENQNLRSKIEAFKEMHMKTTEIIEKVEKKKESLTKKAYENILNEKQTLFIYLQSGDMKKAKKKMIEIEKKIK